MLGLGCMRLSTVADRNDIRAREVLRTALAAGITLLDTSDAYALDATEVGHNEQLIADVLTTVDERPTVVTKGGLVRPGGTWVPDGRARHLAEAARDSRARLGGSALDLYLLHALDPKTSLATSVRALARLRDGGVARQIGLSNVTRHHLDQALAITAIDAIEIELSAYKTDALRTGLVAACRDRGIQVLAHRPLGGAAGVRRLERDAVVGELAARAGVTACELALAWLQQHGVVPLPGATRVATAESAARANGLVLDAEIVRALDAHLLELSAVEPVAPAADPREVVILMGMPAAGKSTLAADYAARGYLRLNRDDRGGTLLELSRVLDRELAAGARRVILDNTYGTRSSRAHVVAVAQRHQAVVRCVIAATSLEQAQANAVARMLAEHGRLLEPAELRRAGAILPTVQFRYRRDYEPPQLDEGFASIEEVAFERRPSVATRRALIVELDDLVWLERPRSPDEVELIPLLRERLRAFAAAGYVLAGTTWLTPPAVDARLVELLGVPIVVTRCAHPAGPPVCWCRKPMPGLALAFAASHDVDLARSVHVGRGPADRGFALRAGLRYVDVADGFPDP